MVLSAFRGQGVGFSTGCVVVFFGCGFFVRVCCDVGGVCMWRADGTVTPVARSTSILPVRNNANIPPRYARLCWFAINVVVTVVVVCLLCSLRPLGHSSVAAAARHASELLVVPLPPPERAEMISLGRGVDADAGVRQSTVALESSDEPSAQGSGSVIEIEPVVDAYGAYEGSVVYDEVATWVRVNATAFTGCVRWC